MRRCPHCGSGWRDGKLIEWPRGARVPHTMTGASDPRLPIVGTEPIPCLSCEWHRHVMQDADLADCIEQIVAVAMAAWLRSSGQLRPGLDIVYRYDGGWVVLPWNAQV